MYVMLMELHYLIAIESRYICLCYRRLFEHLRSNASDSEDNLDLGDEIYGVKLLVNLSLYNLHLYYYGIICDICNIDWS
jgi:hypothetical protein